MFFLFSFFFQYPILSQFFFSKQNLFLDSFSQTKKIDFFFSKKNKIFQKKKKEKTNRNISDFTLKLMSQLKHQKEEPQNQDNFFIFLSLFLPPPFSFFLKTLEKKKKKKTPKNPSKFRALLKNQTFEITIFFYHCFNI